MPAERQREPLTHALCCCLPDAVELRRRAAVEVVVAGHGKDLEALLLLGVPPSACDRVKRTLLHHACRRGDAALVAVLSQLSVDVDAQDVAVSLPRGNIYDIP